MNNFINFGYGFPMYKNNTDFRGNPEYHYGFLNKSKMINTNKAVYFLPPSIMPDEVFVPLSELYVPHTYGRYLISNYGRLFDKFMERFVPFRLNKKYNENNNSNDGYCSAHISYFTQFGNQRTIDIYIHRAVLISFNYIEGCENLEVNHKNLIHTDNRLCNLEWVTSKENSEHMIINNAKNYDCTKDDRNIILNNELVEFICEKLSSGLKPFEIHNIILYTQNINIPNSIIYNILSGIIYREISYKYDFTNSININIPEECIHYICKRLSDGIEISEIFAETGVDKYLILDIKNRKIYKDISIQYDFTKANLNDKFNHSLSEAKIREICRRLQNNVPIKNISKELNVGTTTIAKIKSGKIYQDISKEYTINPYKKDNLNEELIRNICKDIESGMKQIDIARKYDISRITIGHIQRKETYTDISKDYNF